MAPHKLRHLRFHCLLQQLTRSVSQNLRQRIRHWQSDSWIPVLNYAIFFHGVFSLAIRLMVRGKTHQEYATYFIRSYPTFKHNSIVERTMYIAYAVRGFVFILARRPPQSRPAFTGHGSGHVLPWLLPVGTFAGRAELWLAFTLAGHS